MYLEPDSMDSHLGQHSSRKSTQEPSIPLSFSRPRRATLALNAAYNLSHLQDSSTSGFVFGTTDSALATGEKLTVTKYAVHGENRDRETVENWRLTESMRRGLGVENLYPTIENKGRKIVDWEAMYVKELNWQ